MKRLRLFGVSIALVFAFTVLGVSLTSVNFVQSAGSPGDKTDKQFYLADEILPDHIFYPVLMIIDRIKLETAAPLDRVYLETEYANRRLTAAEALLLEKNTPELALTTLTKAQKYLLHAGGDVLDNDMPAAVKEHVALTIAYHQSKLKEIEPLFDDEQRAVVEKLNEELTVISDQIISEL